MKGRHIMRCSLRWSLAVVWFACGLAAGMMAADFKHQAAATPVKAESPDVSAGQGSPPEDGKLHIICFGAHPDDCELQAAGVGAMWARKGHHVKFVSVTNGDIGHWREAGGPLARRRKAEVESAARILGIATEVL